ncbi:hypothetical protein [Nocardiopsis quinghaiensis]|uniref:hypothetical protein n=1 Tax=Nocardiopsis quinghaiensis TaxID=464995 RepID=UPI00123C29A2|nr:hypothetical protein [Nocardiopsis quinghaiensis]
MKNKLNLVKSITGFPGDGSTLDSLRWILKNPHISFEMAKMKLISLRMGGRGEESTDHAPDDKDWKGFIRDLEEDIEDFHGKLFGAQMRFGIKSASDSRMFSSPYLKGDPFVRLELRPVRLGLGRGVDQFRIEVDLLLHRSGVAVLTFVAPMPEGQHVANISKMSASSEGLAMDSVMLATDVWDGPLAPAEDFIRDSIILEEEGTRWRLLERVNLITLQDLFRLYSARVIGHTVTKNSEPENWMCYTTVSLSGMPCCRNRKTWIRRHSRDLARLVMRTSSAHDFRAEYLQEILSKDRSKVEGSSHFFMPGNALLVDWSFPYSERDGDDMAASDYQHLALIENVLIQFWQLRSIDSEMKDVRVSPLGVAEVQRSIAQGINEYMSAVLSRGTSREVVDSISQGLGLDRLYSRVMDRSNKLDQLANSTSSALSARNSFLLAILVGLVAVVAGLPAIEDTVDSISVVAKIIPQEVQEFLPEERVFSLGVYFSFVLAFISTTAFLALRSLRNRRVGRSRDFGVQWTESSQKVWIVDQ